MLCFQKGVTAYIDRKPHKFPKRSPAKSGSRARSHFDVKQRRMLDYFAKQHYYDLMNETIDGNDKPDFKGILTGSNLTAADAFFDTAYSLYQEKLAMIEAGQEDDSNILDHDSDGDN